MIPGTKHARGYLQRDGASELKDVTYINPGSSDGDMISTADDLNKFFSYLLGGKLLKEQQLKQMLTTVPTEEKELDMVLESLKLSFQMVSRYGDTEGRSRVFHFCWWNTWRQAYIGRQFEQL